MNQKSLRRLVAILAGFVVVVVVVVGAWHYDRWRDGHRRLEMEPDTLCYPCVLAHDPDAARIAHGTYRVIRCIAVPGMSFEYCQIDTASSACWVNTYYVLRESGDPPSVDLEFIPALVRLVTFPLWEAVVESSDECTHGRRE